MLRPAAAVPLVQYCRLQGYKKDHVKKSLPLILCLLIAGYAGAQKVDSIYFHLYTDSLKKGQHNYINVDGKMSDGRWQPLNAKQLIFSCPDASFEGNELIIPFDFKPEKVTVKVVLKDNPAVWKQVTIWIKQLPDPPLPTRDEIPSGKRRRN
jgi:hypothetical protein